MKIALLLLPILIVGCGGGSSGGSATVGTISTDRSVITLQAAEGDHVSDELVELSISNTGNTPLTLVNRQTNNGIELVELIRDNSSEARIRIPFKQPSEKGAGFYNDVLTIRACIDTDCKAEAEGSPLFVETQYQVVEKPIEPEPEPEPGTNTPDQTNIQEIDTLRRDINATDIAWDRMSNRLYATVRSSSPDPNIANSIVALNPDTLETVQSQFAGSEPSQIAISNDGKYAYVSFEQASEVKRFSLPSLTPDLTIPLPPSRNGGNLFAYALAVNPDNSESFAAVLATSGTSNSSENIVIYDNAIPRVNDSRSLSNAGSIRAGSIVWPENASTLYASNLGSTSASLFVLSANQSGFTSFEDHRESSGLNRARPHLLDGRIYSDNGDVFDSESLQKVGRYQTSDNGGFGSLALDANIRRVFIAYTTFEERRFAHRIAVFNLDTFALLARRAVRVTDETAGDASSARPKSSLRISNNRTVYLARENFGNGQNVDGTIVVIADDYDSDNTNDN